MAGCDPGQAFDTNDVCENCAAGKYQDESGYAGECKHCLDHSNNEVFVYEGTEFPSDRVGLFTSTQAGSSTCGDCVANAESSSGTCQCSAGYYRVYTLQDYTGAAVDRCDPCPVNTFKSAVGVVAGCVSDSSWTDGYDNCDAYENNILTTTDDWCGYADPTYGDSRSHCCICTDYDPHDYDAVDPATMIWVQSQCTTCPANSYATTATNVDATACKCNAGYTGPDGGPCVACEVGKYKSGTGSAACDYCVNHDNNEYYVHDGTITTERVGLFTSESGSSTCGVCVANAESHSNTCKCSAGYYRAYAFYRPFDLDRCDPCPINTYKSTVGVVSGCQNDDTWSDDGGDTCVQYEFAIFTYNDDYCACLLYTSPSPRDRG